MKRLIPREVLFGNPVKTSPQISPDGKRISYLAPRDGVLNVWVKSIGRDEDQPVTRDADRGIRNYFWAEDNEHLMYFQDVGGSEDFHLYAVHLRSGKVRDLTPFEKVKVDSVDHNKHFPNELLIWMNKEDPKLFDTYRLDFSSGQMERVLKNPGNFIGWLTDAKLRVGAVMAAEPDGGVTLKVSGSDGTDWKDLITWDADDRMTSGPLSFSKDGRFLYLRDSRDANTGRLIKMEVSSRNTEIVAEDPHYDVSGAMFNPDTYELEMVSFTKERIERKVFDTSLEGDIKEIGRIHRGDFFIVSRDREDTTWLVGFTVDDGPIPFYAYDRRTKKVTFLFDNQPRLNDYQLAKTEPISFPSRDGLTIHGYRTCPVDGAGKRLPFVLNVHGGPWVRDTWGYNPEAQWMANRGYGCLQINYRGSTGYGKDFANAGDKEWGGKMHEDLVDAVRWVVDQGMADPKRIAIYGGSYGGYAALVGATFTPDLFRCAIDIVGPSNLVTFIRTIPPYWGPLIKTFHKRVGNPDTEEEFLRSRSPLFKADQIKIPLLIAQGANDPRVKKAESEQIIAALKEKGIEYEYLLFPDEGHGFAKPENRLKFYAAAEKFLAKQLGGDCET